MNRLLIASLLFLLPSCVIVLGEGHHIRRGSGQRVEQSRQTSNFEGVEFRGAGELEIQVGESLSVTLSGDDDLIGEVTTEVHDGTLVIKYPREFRFREDLHVSISLPSLKDVNVLGSADVNIKDMQGPHLHLGINGSGNIKANGVTDTLQVRISGSGDLELTRLVAIDADVEISGSGDVELNVAKSLHYAISGSGDIEYIGSAHAQGSVSGSGSIERSESSR